MRFSCLIVVSVLAFCDAASAFFRKPKTVGHAVRRSSVLDRALRLRGGDHVQTAASLAQVEAQLHEAGNTLVVLYFTATWCGPCQQIKPVYEALAIEMGAAARFLKIDVDENAETAADYDVFQMPTFVFVKNGEVIHQFSGASAEVLRQKVLELSDTPSPAPAAAAATPADAAEPFESVSEQSAAPAAEAAVSELLAAPAADAAAQETERSIAANAEL